MKAVNKNEWVSLVTPVNRGGGGGQVFVAISYDVHSYPQLTLDSKGSHTKARGERTSSDGHARIGTY